MSAPYCARRRSPLKLGDFTMGVELDRASSTAKDLIDTPVWMLWTGESLWARITRGHCLPGIGAGNLTGQK